MFHPIQWWRQRRFRVFQFRLSELDVEIELCQKFYDLLISTIKLGNRMESRLRLMELGIDLARCQFILDLQIGPRLAQLLNERFEAEKGKRELEFLIGQN